MACWPPSSSHRKPDRQAWAGMSGDAGDALAEFPAGCRVRSAADLIAQRQEFAAEPRGTRRVHEACHAAAMRVTRSGSGSAATRSRAEVTSGRRRTCPCRHGTLPGHAHAARASHAGLSGIRCPTARPGPVRRTASDPAPARLRRFARPRSRPPARTAAWPSPGLPLAMPPDNTGDARIFFIARYSYDRDRVSCLRTVWFTADPDSAC